MNNYSFTNEHNNTLLYLKFNYKALGNTISLEIRTYFEYIMCRMDMDTYIHTYIYIHGVWKSAHSE